VQVGGEHAVLEQQVAAGGQAFAIPGLGAQGRSAIGQDQAAIIHQGQAGAGHGAAELARE